MDSKLAARRKEGAGPKSQPFELVIGQNNPSDPFLAVRAPGCKPKLPAWSGWLFIVVTSRNQLWRSQFLSMNGKAVRLGMDKARAKGKAIGRPMVVDRVDAALVVQLRQDGKSWREIAEAHPVVKSASGKRIKPSAGSIRRACRLSSLR
jgi:hypothetical protein